MFIISLFTSQHLRQSLPLLVALVISLNISSCGCGQKSAPNPSSSDTSTGDPTNKATDPKITLTSINGLRLIGNTPFILAIKNTGTQPIKFENLKLKIIRTCGPESCPVYRELTSKQIPASGQITETIPITPGKGQQVTFTCQLIQQEGGKEKLVGKPLIVEWESEDLILRYNVTCDEYAKEMLCTIHNKKTESIQGVRLHYQCKTTGVKLNGNPLDTKQVLVMDIKDLPAGNKLVSLGKLDFGDNSRIEFDYWLTYIGGPTEYTKQPFVFKALDICLAIAELYYDLEKNRIGYKIRNSGPDMAKDIKLHYNVGSTVLIAGKKEGNIKLEDISGGSSISGELAVDPQSADKFKIALGVIHKGMPLGSLCRDVVLPKLRLVTASDFLLGKNKTIRFKIEDENNLPIDSSKLSIRIEKPAGDDVKVFYKNDEITQELSGLRLGCLDNPVQLTIEPGAATKTSIVVQLVYYDKVVANRTFTWQNDVSQATKELFEAVNENEKWSAKMFELPSEGSVQISRQSTKDPQGSVQEISKLLPKVRKSVNILFKKVGHVTKVDNLLTKLEGQNVDLNGVQELEKLRMDLKVQIKCLLKKVDPEEILFQNDEKKISDLLSELSNKIIQVKCLLKKVNPDKKNVPQDDVDEMSGLPNKVQGQVNKESEKVDQEHMKKIHELLSKGDVQINAADEQGETLLWKASLNNNREAVLALLEVPDIQVNSNRHYDYTLLQWYVQRRDPDIVAALLDKGANINDRINDEMGYTALHLAIDTGDLAMLGLLLKNPCINPNTLDKSGASPLHLAISKGNQEIIDQLLQRGADVNAVNNSGETSLHMLRSFEGNQEIISKLLQKGANMSAVNNFGSTTPLYTAIQKGEVDVNAQDSLGNTLLHYAVAQENDVVVKLLVEKGAELDLENKQKQTPRDWFIKLQCSCKKRLACACK